MENLKLLLVDDEPIILRGLVETYDWEEMGFTLAGYAENGEQAIQLIRETKPHLVLTDIRMKQMTGLELMEQVKLFAPDILFVVISAYRDFEYAQKACEIGAFSYLVKPIEEEKLQEVMQSACDLCMEQMKNKEEHDNFKRLLIGEKDNFLQVIMQKYLQGALNEEKVKEVLHMLNKEITWDDTFICVSADMDISFKIMDPVYYETERTCLFCYLEQTFEQRYPYWKIEHQNGMHCYLLHSRERRGVDGVRAILKEAQISLNSPVISAISGEYHGFEGIGRTFKQAVRFFETATEAGANAFTVSRQEAEESEEQISTQDVEQMVMNSIRKNDKQQLKDAFVKFIYILPPEKQEGKQNKYIHKLAISVEFMLQDSYGSNGTIEKSFQNFYANLNTMSASKAIDICYKLFCQVIDERLQCAKSRDIAYFSEYMSVALAYIDENLNDESLSLSAVASEVYLNPVYFGRVFKNTKNISFKQYVLQKRMEFAKKLIVEGKESISVICEKVGIPNRSYFTQVFKQYTGFLPSEYKKEQ